jgi:hypothetical protein
MPMTEEGLHARLLDIDTETTLIRRQLSEKSARLKVLRAERKKLLTDNPAMLTYRQLKYASAMARKRGALVETQPCGHAAAEGRTPGLHHNDKHSA